MRSPASLTCSLETVTLSLRLNDLSLFIFESVDVLSGHLLLWFFFDALSGHQALICTYLDYCDLVITPTETESETAPRPGQPLNHLRKPSDSPLPYLL